MKRVWRCDFCPHNEISKEKMEEHEKTCSSNPIFKKCWSCKFQQTNTYDWGYHCRLTDSDSYEYEDDGNCPNWKTDNEKLLRKIKIENINKSNW